MLHKRRLPLLCVVLLVTTLSLSSILSAKEFYRWIDEEGVVHYTDKPPVGQASEIVNMSKSPKPTLLADQEKAKQTDKTTDASPEASVKESARCAQEEERLKTLKSNRRIQIRDANGELRELSEAEIQEEIAFSELAVKKYCE